MIETFKVTNFLSFKEEQILSFVPTSDTSHIEDYCIEVKKGVKLLKTAFIYGANASGKTNLLAALDFLRDIAIISAEDKTEELPVTPFLLNDTSRNESTHFFLTFYLENEKYQYDVTLTSQRIITEKLSYYPGTQPAIIYNRTYDTINDKSTVTFGKSSNLTKKEQELLEGNTYNNRSVLASIRKTNISKSVLDKVSNYFISNLSNILQPGHNLSSFVIDKIKAQPEITDFLIKQLQESDFNVCRIEPKSAEIPISEPEQKLLKELELSDDIATKDTYKKQWIEYTHRTSVGEYSLEDRYESRGTNRYTGMAAILYDLLHTNSAMCIDEIESSLHYDLLSHLIKLFLVNGRKQSQLIITTHNLKLLDEDFIRRDVVWFAEKNSEGETKLSRLSDKKLHKNVSIYNAYKHGKLGAKPTLGSIFIDD